MQILANKLLEKEGTWQRENGKRPLINSIALIREYTIGMYSELLNAWMNEWMTGWLAG